VTLAERAPAAGAKVLILKRRQYLLLARGRVDFAA